MKLRNQVLSVISPIIIVGLLLLAITALILIKERKEFVLSDDAGQAHIALSKGFSEILDKNNNDVFLFTLVDSINQILHEFVVNQSTPELQHKLSKIIAQIYDDEHAANKTGWQILTDEAVELGFIGIDNKVKIAGSELNQFLPQLPHYETIERLTLVGKNLFAISIHDVTNALITLYGGEIKHRVYIAVYRQVPAPAKPDAKYKGIVHSAINTDDMLRVFSPLNNPIKDQISVQDMLALKSENNVLVYKEAWSNFVVMTIADLGYAEDWSEIFLYTLIWLIVASIGAIGLVVWVLNRSILTPISWLSEHISSGDIFKKPTEHPSIGSTEMKALYRGIVKSSRRLESVRLAMEEASLIDELTGLGNRRLFYKTLGKEVAASNRRGTQFALLLIDLDNFKYVNDAYGHDTGDKLLTKFSNLLKEQIRTEDTLYNIIESQHITRLGGDEFAVILKDIESPTQSAIVAERIIKKMNAGISVDDMMMPVTSSIGISVFPSDADNPKNLMLCVDAAMYQAKGRGKNGYCFYNKKIASQLARELEVEKLLREDFADHKLELFVQPVFHTKNLELAGGEVLLRWCNDKLGMVSPAEFIPIAEKIGLIREIDIWVIEQTCKQIQQVKQTKGFELEGLAINISALETRNRKFASRVKNICERFDVAPESIELEITETALIEDLEAAETVTSQLKEMGIKIALDDFGTGYSSISHLKDVRFDKLKIDRSFVVEIDDKKESFLVADISLLLAHGMNMTITAEGVESDTQLDYLQLSGCDYVQGFKLAKPMPMFEYIKLVEQNKHGAPASRMDKCN